MKLSTLGFFATLIATLMLPVLGIAQPREIHCVSSGAQFRSEVVARYDRLIQSFLEDPTTSNKDLGSLFGVLMLTDALVDTSLRPEDLQITVAINSANQATLKIKTQAFADSQSEADQQLLYNSIGKMPLFRKEGRYLPNKKEITAANLMAIKIAILELPANLHLPLKPITTEINLHEPLVLASEASGSSKIALYQATESELERAKIVALGVLEDGSKLVISTTPGKSALQNRQMTCQIPSVGL